MSDEEKMDALDGIMAYDQGCVDSGIHDELLRARLKNDLMGMNEEEFRLFTSRLARRYLDEDALAEGYGLEDVKSMIEWFSDYMGIDI